MARRPGDGPRRSFTPNQRRLAGWAVALALVVGVAVAVSLLGGNGDGASVAPEGSASSPAASVAEIVFGTAIDQATGEVATTSRVARFQADDSFAYSVRPVTELPDRIYVEVERTAGGPLEIVQAIPSPGAQPLPEDAEVIAFSVPAIDLLDAFGPGTFEMRIHLDAAADPVAKGTFELVDPAPPASGAPSSSP